MFVAWLSESRGRTQASSYEGGSIKVKGEADDDRKRHF